MCLSSFCKVSLAQTGNRSVLENDEKTAFRHGKSVPDRNAVGFDGLLNLAVFRFPRDS
jgi:hypothetical protein